MAKDPAVLFYTSDFLSGVMDLDMTERGQYITLLCAQHQKGHLSDKTIRLLVGNVSVSVLQKFNQDEQGLFYNERMELESDKRKQFVESRQLNGKKGGRPKNLMVNHKDHHTHNLMENENENENRNINEDREKGVVGEKGKEPNLPELHTQKYYEQSLDDHVWLEQVCRSTKKEPYQIPKLLEQFNADMLARQEYHPTIRDYRSHFVNWVKKSETEIKKNKKNNAPLTIEHIASVVEQAKHIRVTLGNFDSPREDQVP